MHTMTRATETSTCSPYRSNVGFPILNHPPFPTGTISAHYITSPIQLLLSVKLSPIIQLIRRVLLSQQTPVFHPLDSVIFQHSAISL